MVLHTPQLYRPIMHPIHVYKLWQIHVTSKGVIPLVKSLVRESKGGGETISEVLICTIRARDPDCKYITEVQFSRTAKQIIGWNIRQHKNPFLKHHKLQQVTSSINRLKMLAQHHLVYKVALVIWLQCSGFRFRGVIIPRGFIIFS